MKKLKINAYYLLGFFFVLNSCTDDLNVVPTDDDVFLSEQFFAQPGAYKSGLAGVYGNLALTGAGDAGSSFLQGIDAGTSQFTRCLWYLQNLTTDEVIWSYENDPGTRELQRNIWNESNPLILGMFSRTMAEVALANEYLRQTTPAKLSGRGVTDATLLSDIEDYRNEVRVLRAYAYYNLMDLYGKAPFLTEADPINTVGPEYDRAELFAFIESELTEVLPNLKAPRTNEGGRLDQGFARMVLAKIYLNAEVYIGANRYADCLTQCTQIISGGYALKPNYLDNFKADNNTSEEMIFTIQSDGQVTQSYGATTVMVNGQIGSLEANGTSFGVGSGGWGGALRLRKQFVQKFDGVAYDFDARKTISGGGPRALDIADIADKNQGYILSKFSNISSTGIPGGNSTFVNTDFPLFRLADVYLMYAEAQMRRDGATNGSTTTNVSSESLVYLNSLRERANDGNFANVASSDVTLDFIIDERARELHWEGHRRQDLIRFGKYTGGSYNWAWKGNGVNGISISNNLKLFPIPAQSLASNPNLTQNPGY
ncbi:MULTISPECIES: RagB/SusD family nutrient uptake outer membrane protein [unclassified Flavobacterium]|uniref:RagB/SusD family nutrient uptake outer membrane protein n=1 Tax=unclassified Flavobacterium TaxID=196869 RepID=UPI000EAEF0A7|nr:MULTISPECIES: RagB/SusD family nutrient uptake outer membrane protein [unclassified Flavobacterium]RKS01501.1 SusD-like starch-binding protein associating with outer membrane [Flavobacterium sp. 102]